ncbi:MAG: HIT family protein [Candidatus Bathyarchaeia archaeon]
MTQTKTDCIFCRIARREAPASVVYEDEKVMAFMDIRPVSEGHTLVIPKQHYVDVFDTPEELVAYTHGVTKRIAAAVKKATDADGISIVQQNGTAAGQDIFHLHVHVIPRFESQSMPKFHELKPYSRESLDEAAARIRQAL